jgi:branched-chain amino acid aminotransferase
MQPKFTQVFLNGRIVPESKALVPVHDRGLLLGDGLFETIRVAGGRPFRLAQHLERMTRGAEFLKIAAPYPARELQKHAENLIAENAATEAVLRVTLTRGIGVRGYSPRGASNPTLVMTLHELPETDPNEPLQWSMVTSALRIPASDNLSSFKTTSKLWNVMARAEAEDRGADEALLVNTNGEVAEAAGGNIFWVYRDKICTVPTGRGVLPGITRAVVLEICQSLGLETNKRVIKPEHLRQGEGIFITQSALGIVPVVAFDGGPVAPSPLVDQIITAYEDMLRRE